MRCQASRQAGMATGKDEYISQAGSYRESDEAIVAMKRVMIVERRASTARARSQREGEPIG
jgi:hypothetical protein